MILGPFRLALLFRILTTDCLGSLSGIPTGGGLVRISPTNLLRSEVYQPCTSIFGALSRTGSVVLAYLEPGLLSHALVADGWERPSKDHESAGVKQRSATSYQGQAGKLWLVGGLEHVYVSIHWEFHHPNWLIFGTGVETTNQMKLSASMMMTLLGENRPDHDK